MTPSLGSDYIHVTIILLSFTALINQCTAVSKVRVNDVIMELSEVETLWYLFGVYIGVPKPKLDQIQAKCSPGPCPHRWCLIETICQWKDNHENATWYSIVQALYSMQKKPLAKRVATKHSKLRKDR